MAGVIRSHRYRTRFTEIVKGLLSWILSLHLKSSKNFKKTLLDERQNVFKKPGGNAFDIFQYEEKSSLTWITKKIYQHVLDMWVVWIACWQVSIVLEKSGFRRPVLLLPKSLCHRPPRLLLFWLVQNTCLLWGSSEYCLWKTGPWPYGVCLLFKIYSTYGSVQSPLHLTEYIILLSLCLSGCLVFGRSNFCLSLFLGLKWTRMWCLLKILEFFRHTRNLGDNIFSLCLSWDFYAVIFVSVSIIVRYLWL